MEQYYIIRKEEYLKHHGIKGQKWGLRRYQNEDGTLTEEGKQRYGVSSDGKMSKAGEKIYNIDRKEAVHIAKLERSKLVKEHGKELADSMIKEKYGNITYSDLKKASAGKKVGAGVAIGAVGTAATIATGIALTAAFAKAVITELIKSI